MTKVKVTLSVDDTETLKSLVAEQKEWIETESEVEGDAEHIQRLERLRARLEKAQQRAIHLSRTRP
jgi:hypothetical protein